MAAVQPAFPLCILGIDVKDPDASIGDYGYALWRPTTESLERMLDLAEMLRGAGAQALNVFNMSAEDESAEFYDMPKGWRASLNDPTPHPFHQALRQACTELHHAILFQGETGPLAPEHEATVQMFPSASVHVTSGGFFWSTDVDDQGQVYESGFFELGQVLELYGRVIASGLVSDEVAALDRIVRLDVGVAARVMEAEPRLAVTSAALSSILGSSNLKVREIGVRLAHRACDGSTVRSS